MKVNFYGQKVPKFINQLESTTKSKVGKQIELLQEYNYALTMPHAKKIGDNLFELRVKSKQLIRLFYTFKNNQILIFYGIIKKTNKIPVNDIESVKNILKEVNKIDTI